MESQPRQPPPRPKRARRRPAPSREATGKIVSVRTKQLRRLGLGADFAAGMEVSPGVVLLLRDDGVEFRVASGDLKEAYRVANDWAVAIRETASVPVRVQTLARDA
jgi:hypothetical protein